MSESSESRSGALELLTTILLGVATAVSAWCTYEAQLWNSRQLKELARGNVLQAASLRATVVGTREAIMDVTTFAAVLGAESRADRNATRYIVEVARPEFRGPLRAWVERAALAGPRAVTPFDDPSYRDALLKEPRDLQAQADRALEAASAANANSDLYVMRTVTIALSLFFLGIAGQLRTNRARYLAVGIGALVLLLSVLSLTWLERAAKPRRGSDDLVVPSATQN